MSKIFQLNKPKKPNTEFYSTSNNDQDFRNIITSRCVEDKMNNLIESTRFEHKKNFLRTNFFDKNLTQNKEKNFRQQKINSEISTFNNGLHCIHPLIINNKKELNTIVVNTNSPMKNSLYTPNSMALKHHQPINKIYLQNLFNIKGYFNKKKMRMKNYNNKDFVDRNDEIDSKKRKEEKKKLKEQRELESFAVFTIKKEVESEKNNSSSNNFNKLFN